MLWLFFTGIVLLEPLDESIAPIRAKRKHHPPTVLTEEEVGRIFAEMVVPIC